jgi:hypothetical protein
MQAGSDPSFVRDLLKRDLWLAKLSGRTGAMAPTALTNSWNEGNDRADP